MVSRADLYGVFYEANFFRKSIHRVMSDLYEISYEMYIRVHLFMIQLIAQSFMKISN